MILPVRVEQPEGVTEWAPAHLPGRLPQQTAQPEPEQRTQQPEAAEAELGPRITQAVRKSQFRTK